jgi:hypothetical protein
MTEIIWDWDEDVEQEREQFGPLISWAGGDCPVHPDTRVKALFRGRQPYVGPAIRREMPKEAQENMWQHAPAGGNRFDPKYDIVGYQVAL